VGIDVAAWRAAFTARAAKEDLQADLQRAVQLGIHVVPSLVINEKYLVSGALPLADLLQAVDRVAAEEK
jgi:predicted DsbA family dithiol-disulfide isomerase